MCWTDCSSAAHSGRVNIPHLLRARHAVALVVFATALAPVVWGTTYVVATELLPTGHPLLTGALRALPAGLLALALSRQLPCGHWWWRALLLGTLNIGAFFPLLFLAAEHLPGGVAAVLGAVQPLVVAGLAVVILREAPSWRSITWAVLGVLGVALVVLGPTARLDVLGVSAGLAGAVAMATGVVLTKRWGRPADVTPLGYAGWQLTAGGLVLAPLALAVEGLPGRVTAAAVTGYAWLGLIGGLVAYTLWFRGIGRLPVMATALLGLLSPLTAAALGALLLSERLAPLQLLGFSLGLLALLAGQLPQRRRRHLASSSVHARAGLPPHRELCPGPAGARSCRRHRSGNYGPPSLTACPRKRRET